MKDTPPHLKELEEIERECIPGLVEVLREDGLVAVRYVLWDATDWHHNYDPPVEEPDYRGAEEDRLGDGGEDREDPVHGPARGTQAAGRGDDGDPRRGTGRFYG